MHAGPTAVKGAGAFAVLDAPDCALPLTMLSPRASTSVTGGVPSCPPGAAHSDRGRHQRQRHTPVVSWGGRADWVGLHRTGGRPSHEAASAPPHPFHSLHALVRPTQLNRHTADTGPTLQWSLTLLWRSPNRVALGGATGTDAGVAPSYSLLYRVPCSTAGECDAGCGREVREGGAGGRCGRCGREVREGGAGGREGSEFGKDKDLGHTVVRGEGQEAQEAQRR